MAAVFTTGSSPHAILQSHQTRVDLCPLLSSLGRVVHGIDVFFRTGQIHQRQHPFKFHSLHRHVVVVEFAGSMPTVAPPSTSGRRRAGAAPTRVAACFFLGVVFPPHVDAQNCMGPRTGVVDTGGRRGPYPASESNKSNQILRAFDVQFNNGVGPHQTVLRGQQGCVLKSIQ